MDGQKVDVVALILESSLNGLPSARLGYKTKLRPKLLEEYLNVLLSKELISLKPYPRTKRKEKIVQTTDRGRMFLEMYKSIKTRYLTHLSEV